jgi:hypothetical protein
MSTHRHRNDHIAVPSRTGPDTPGLIDWLTVAVAVAVALVIAGHRAFRRSRTTDKVAS